ncbi:hypothetical protein IW262DRAFT_691348 [Armillaria fumosa]|nr:hypothetical protein IW262DRAFT_691348 [Armillaria fumosa]
MTPSVIPLLLLRHLSLMTWWTSISSSPQLLAAEVETEAKTYNDELLILSIIADMSNSARCSLSADWMISFHIWVF